MAAAIDEAATNDHLLDERGAIGRARHQALFTPEGTIARLVEIYEHALDAAEPRTPH